MLNLLVIEGETAAGRAEHAAGFGRTYGQSYADTLRALAPDARVDLCAGADEGATLPDGAALEGYDGVVITGSSLHVYEAGPSVARQVALARAVFASGTPFFGSCWGLQVATAAAGGDVLRNPRGREAGVARDIAATAAGAGHPLLAGRAARYDAPAMHLDVVALPAGTAALAQNALAPVQAAEIRHAGGVFWGVQYHPEFSLAEMAAILGRVAGPLVREGFFADEAALRARCGAMRALDADPSDTELARANGLSGDVVEAGRRTIEVANFIDRLVRPTKSARGRA